MLIYFFIFSPDEGVVIQFFDPNQLLEVSFHLILSIYKVFYILSSKSPIKFLKSTGTKRGKLKIFKIISKNNLAKELSMLQKKLSNFNWSPDRKFIFGIKKNFLNTYLNVFLSKSYKKHFSDFFSFSSI